MKIIANVCLVLAVTSLLSACQPRQGNEPIITAVAKNDATRVTQYLAEGGDPEFTSRDGDPLLYIASGPRGGIEVAALLIKAGANPNAKSADGRTILQNAASWCDLEMVALVIEAGADVNLAGKDGERPIEVVCKSPEDRRNAMIELLRAAGAVGG